MDLGLRLGLGGGTTALQLAFAKTPGMLVHANYRSNLYYASSQTYGAASGVTDSVPAGEPTSAGMLINGSDAPTLVQGYGPERLSNVGGPFTSLDSFTANGATLSLDAGRVLATTDGAGGAFNTGFYTTFDTIIGATYYVTTTHEGGTNRCDLAVGPSAFSGTLVNGSETNAGVTGSFVYSFVATSTTTYVSLRILDAAGLTDKTCFLHAVSIKQVLLHPGYSGTDHTFKVEWNADGVTGDRVVWEARKDANNRIALHFVSGILRLEAFVGSVSQGFVAVAGVDDGGSHSAVLYWDEVSGTLSLDVDGQGLEGPELFADQTPGIDQGGSGANGTYVDATNTMANDTAGSNVAYPRFGFNLGLVAGLLYDVQGLVSGDIARVYSVRLATSGSANNVSYDSGTGIFSGEATASGNQLEILTDGTGTFSIPISSLSVKATYTRSGLTLPTNLSQIALGHSGGANQLNGYIQELSAANGDRLAAWA